VHTVETSVVTSAFGRTTLVLVQCKPSPFILITFVLQIDLRDEVSMRDEVNI